jgi:hypothetical protein
MRLRGGDLQRLGWWPPETRLIPDWVRLLDRVSPGVGGRCVVATRADRGARADADPAATMGAGRPVLGDGHMAVGSSSMLQKHLVIVRRKEDALYAQLTSQPWREFVTVMGIGVKVSVG